MKNKSLTAAAAFSLAALVFLLWSWSNYSSAKTEADNAQYHWDSSTSDRQRFVDLQANPELKELATTTVNRDDVPGVMGKLVEESGLQISQLRIDPTGTIASEESASSVKLSLVDISVMGELLERLRSRHKGLYVREIVMTEPKGAGPAVFNWSLVIGVPKQTTVASRAPAAPKAAEPSTPVEKLPGL